MICTCLKMKVVHIQLFSLPPIKAVSAYALEDGLTNDLVSITYLPSTYLPTYLPIVIPSRKHMSWYNILIKVAILEREKTILIN